MKMRKFISMAAAIGMAVSLMANGHVDMEVKAAEPTLDEMISALDVQPAKDYVELIAEHYDAESDSFLPNTLFLHGNAVIFTNFGAMSGWTKIYMDANKNGLVDSDDTEVNLGTYQETGISGTAKYGYDLSEVTVYAIGSYDTNDYTAHTGDLLITISDSPTIGAIIGSTDLCNQTGDFILKALTNGGEVKLVEGAGAGAWQGNITMSIAGDMIFDEVYGGSKASDTVITGNVLITDNDGNSIPGVFGDSSFEPESGGLFAGGEGTAIHGNFEVLIKRCSNRYVFYDVDASQATVTGNVNYLLASSELYGTLKTNEEAAENSRTSIKIGSFSTEADGSIYLYENEKVIYYDAGYYYATSLAIEPKIKAIDTVVVEAQNGVAFTDSAAYKGLKLNKNTGYVVNSENEYQIVIGRASANVKEISFETGTDQKLDPQLEIKGEAVKLPAPTRSNYEFAGWSDGVNTYAPGSDYTVPDGDVTLTAVWNYVSSNTGSYTPSKGFVKKKGETYFYDKGKPVKDGFVIVNEDEQLVNTVEPGKLTELDDADYKAYYAKPDGGVAEAEWIVLDKDGEFVEAMPIGEFKKQYDAEYKVYLADKNGRLVRSWKDTEGNWYFFNADFSAKYEFWQAHYNDWYYFENYSYIQNTWHATDNGRWYCFDKEGKMIRNQWVDGCWINELGIYWSPIYSDPDYILNYHE